MSLKHAILGFLSFKPMTGYDLKKAFDNSVQHFWPADQSQIYRTLRQLHQAGHISKEVIEREEQLDMKVYDITEDGRDELISWLSQPQSVQSSREPHLIQLYFGALLEDDTMLDMLRDQLAEAEDVLATYTAIYHTAVASSVGADPRWRFYTMLTLEYGIEMNYAYHQWVSAVIDRLERGEMGIKPLEDQLPERFITKDSNRK